jgi:thiamine-monophosphate kinase
MAGPPFAGHAGEGGVSVRLRELGEQGLVDRIKSRILYKSDDIIIGVGDDSCAVKAYSSLLTLVSTDAFVEGNHFSLAYFSLEDLGFKAIAASVSDLAAMGGMPRYCLVSLIAPPTMSMGDMDSLIDGMVKCCSEYDLELVGGDSVGSTILALSVTVVGEVEVENMVLRSGARPGDSVYVTGDLGASEAGRIVLSARMEIERGIAEYVTRRHRVPRARVREARELVMNHSVHAMIDLSDGLSIDAGHIAKESDVKVVLEVEEFPISPEVKAVAEASSTSPLDMALFGGEDFELLFTSFDLGLTEVSGTPIRRIGEVKEGKGVFLLSVDGTETPLPRRGYEHF